MRLHVERAGPAEGVPIILLHGFPEFWWSWRQQIGPLAEAGFRVIVPDMRGYGQSEAPQDIGAYRLERLVEDVIALADSEGAERFTLVGHDWGGIVAWATAAWHPARVSRLVILNAPHLEAMRPTRLRQLEQFRRSWYVAFFQLPRLPERRLSRDDYAWLKWAIATSARRGTFSRRDLEVYAHEWARPGRLRAMLNYYRALIRRRHRRLGRIEPPTLILWGDRDVALRPELADASLALCRDGRLRRFPEATHWLQHEEPQSVAEAILAFIPR